MPTKKIGLYAGTFDPVHEGHIALMEQAIEEVGLDIVYCLPDRLPPNKATATGFAHRIKMLNLALEGKKKIQVLETETDFATFPETIDVLGLGGSDVHILMGSDAAINISKWRNSQQMIERTGLIVGVRSVDDEELVKKAFHSAQAMRYQIITTPYADYSSTQARNSQQEIHPKIVSYIRKYDLFKV